MEPHVATWTRYVYHGFSGRCGSKTNRHATGRVLGSLCDASQICTPSMRAHPNIESPTAGIMPDVVWIMELHQICLKPPDGCHHTLVCCPGSLRSEWEE